MNSKVLLLVTALFVISLLGNAYFILGNSPQAASDKNLMLPLSPDQKGVTSQVLIYNFSGKITEVTPVGNDTRLKLDESDASSPDFIVTKDTKIFKTNNNPGSPPTEVTAADLKLGLAVNFGMAYDLKNKTWNLGGISIVDTAQAPLISPTSTTSGQVPAPITQ
jgi:hypothetical protein